MLTLLYNIIYFILFGPRRKTPLPPLQYWVMVKEGYDKNAAWKNWNILNGSVTYSRYPINYILHQFSFEHCGSLCFSIRNIGPFETEEQAETYLNLVYS